MPELLVLALVIGAVIIILIVLVVSDYQRQRLRLDSSRYEERINDLEDRIGGLELENMRLLDQLKVQARFKSGEGNQN
ncbi:MAG: hypothetical protein Q8R28_02670 [Dehalococcoidia bacterium]|nr:hypothetical protein [Dehalococcoidia bacterium]